MNINDPAGLADAQNLQELANQMFRALEGTEHAPTSFAVPQAAPSAPASVPVGNLHPVDAVPVATASEPYSRAAAPQIPIDAGASPYYFLQGKPLVGHPPPTTIAKWFFIGATARGTGL